jgi:TPP-dependent pyruvate/acetoin dehydrogenase alpha subunit
MGNSVEVSTEALRAYGQAAQEISGRLVAAGAFDQAEHVAALVPVFGVIGQDFLAAFGVAQAQHAAAYTDVAATFGGRARHAHTSADAYEGSDHTHAAALRAIGRALGGQG